MILDHSYDSKHLVKCETLDKCAFNRNNSHFDSQSKSGLNAHQVACILTFIRILISPPVKLTSAMWDIGLVDF